MKKRVEGIIKRVVIVIAMIMIYILALVAGHAIPREWVIENVQTSYEELKNIGLYFEVVKGAVWDNWTDAMYLNSAITEYEGNLLEKAIANAYTVERKLGDVDDPLIEYIKYAITPDENTSVYAYSRYWAGNMTLFKILLIFMPISGIRTLLLMITIILLVMAVLNVNCFLGKRGVIPFLLSIIISLYIPNSMCLVYSSDIIIMLMVINICSVKLKRNDLIRSYYFLFLLTGSICAYVNYWAFPLITLGIPLVFLTSVRLVKNVEWKSVLKENLVMSICWAGGLSGTMLLKQFFCYLILGAQSGTNQLLFRMGKGTGWGERWLSVLQVILREIYDTPVMIILASLIIVTAILINKGAIGKHCNCIPLLVIACYPIVWCFLLAGHNNHGFVRYMYGVLYYGVFSAVALNAEKPSWLLRKQEGMKEEINKFIFFENAGILVVWLIFSYVIMNNAIHFDEVKTQPWSLESIGYAGLEKEAEVNQKIVFDINTPRYIKSVETILVNIPEETKNGVLHVEFKEKNKIIKRKNISISKINVGEWFQIPLGCTIYPNHTYEISYSAVETEQTVPYLLVQEEGQGVTCNNELYINGEQEAGVIVNCYIYDRVLDVKEKIYIICIGGIILQLFFCYIKRFVLTHKVPRL